jgi:16S rRNA (uracil1498-N3)-methyltransferase
MPDNVENQQIWSDIPALIAEKPLPSAGAEAYLDENERRHAGALRLRSGDRVMLLDGAGRRAFGRISQFGKKELVVRVDDSALEEPEQGVYIGLAIGLLDDRSRCEFLYEKCVELGVNSIYPFIGERAEGRFRRERLERIGLAALKQSQRAWLPKLSDPVDLDQLIMVAGEYHKVLVCHEVHRPEDHLALRIREILKNAEVNGPLRLLVVVGPEGGLHGAEVERICREAAGVVVGLGAARLRAETAAIVAVTVLATARDGISSNEHC